VKVTHHRAARQLRANALRCVSVKASVRLVLGESDVRTVAFCPCAHTLLRRHAHQPTTNRSFAPARSLTSAAATRSDARAGDRFRAAPAECALSCKACLGADSQGTCQR
jgi:hypothetical protein